VDFVLQYRGKCLAIEVKSGAARGTSGMKTFQRKFAPDRMLLIARDGLPWQDFLTIEPGALF